jgi:hypothetical protein
VGVAAIFGLLGAGVSAIGSISAGKAAQDAAEYNAKVAEQQAAQERDAAQAEASDYRRSERRGQASSRVARLASGVTMAGSPLLVDEAMAREIALGSARIGYGGSVNANRYENEAELERMSGDAAATASYFRAGTSLLSGASSFF